MKLRLEYYIASLSLMGIPLIIDIFIKFIPSDFVPVIGTPFLIGMCGLSKVVFNYKYDIKPFKPEVEHE